MSQNVRFNSLTRALNFKGKRVLDVGCGNGDFLVYLGSIDQWPSQYTGVDILPEVVKISRLRFNGVRNVYFCQMGDFLGKNRVNDKYDIVVGIGLFSLEFVDGDENYDLVVRWFKKMYEYCSEACGATFLSRYKQEIRPLEAVFQPEELFKSLKDGIDRLVLDHSYAPHVFTIVGFKGETPWHRQVRLEGLSVDEQARVYDKK